VEGKSPAATQGIKKEEAPKPDSFAAHKPEKDGAEEKALRRQLTKRLEMKRETTAAFNSGRRSSTS
jgi:hypothetical protein